MPPTKEARLLNDLTIPQPKVMAAYRLYGPAPAKQINYERQTHTYYNKQLLRPRGSLLPCEPKCQRSRSAADCISLKCLQPHRYSKTDPEALMHLNLYGSWVADDRTLRTLGREGL